MADAANLLVRAGALAEGSYSNIWWNIEKLRPL